MTYKLKNVALGSGLAMMACSHIKSANAASKLRDPCRPLMAVCFVMLSPLRGNETMVCECVHHWARTSDCRKQVSETVVLGKRRRPQTIVDRRRMPSVDILKHDCLSVARRECKGKSEEKTCRVSNELHIRCQSQNGSMRKND